MTPRRFFAHAIWAVSALVVLIYLLAPGARTADDIQIATGGTVVAASPDSEPTTPPTSVAHALDVVEVPATPVAREGAVKRLETIPGTTLPVPIRWGAHGSSIAGRCTQWEPLLAELAPPTGWDVVRMSRYMARESVCCPQVLTDDGWRTTQGGDRFDGDCNLTHIARWNHRSDAGLLQVNGINYDPARCLNTCLSVWLDTPVNLTTLGDPWLNVRAAARLCEFWVNAGRSCYQPWS